MLKLGQSEMEGKDRSERDKIKNFKVACGGMGLGQIKKLAQVQRKF